MVTTAAIALNSLSLPILTAPLPDQAKIASLLVERVKAASIGSAQDAQDGADLRSAIGKRRSALDGMRLDATKDLRDQVDAINGDYNAVINSLKEAEKVLGSTLATYATEQQRIAAKLAEEKRLAEIEAAKKEAADKAAAAAMLEGDAEAQWEAAEAADNVLVVAEKPVVVEAPKLAGFHTRKDWKVEVVDIKALAAAVGAGTIPATVFETSSSALKALAKAGFTTIPGCTVSEVTIPVGR